VIGYVLRRLMQLLPVLLIASLGIWGMIYAVPGRPVPCEGTGTLITLPLPP